MVSPLFQLRSWYAALTGQDVISMVGFATLLPMMLEQIARNGGRWSPEYEIPCSEAKPTEQSICKAIILGHQIETASYTLYIKAIATVCTCIFTLSCGPMADDAYWRKRASIIGPYLGEIMMMMFIFFPARPSVYQPPLAAILAIIAMTATLFGGTTLDSYLPILARQFHGHIPSIVESLDDPGLSESEPLLHSSTSQRPEYSTLDQTEIARQSGDNLEEKAEREAALVTSRIASFQAGIASTSALIMQIVLHFAFEWNMSVKACIAFVSITSMLIASPSFIGLPSGERGLVKWNDGWVKSGKLLLTWRKLPMLWRCLWCWWFQCDVLQTIHLALIMQSTTRLGLNPAQVTVIMGLTMVIMGITAFIGPPIQRFLGVSNVAVALSGNIFGLVAPLWGASSVLNSNWGLRSTSDVYIAVALTSPAFALYWNWQRALYAEMVPRGYEASFFSLYALATRSSSVLGALIVGSITQWTGRFDIAWLVLALVMAAPMPLLASVKTSVGVTQALAYEEENANREER